MSGLCLTNTNKTDTGRGILLVFLYLHQIETNHEKRKIFMHSTKPISCYVLLLAFGLCE